MDTGLLHTSLQGLHLMLLKAKVSTSGILQPNIFGTYRVTRHHKTNLKHSNWCKKKKKIEEKENTYLLFSVSVRSHVSNFHISFSVSGLWYPSFMMGFIQEKSIPTIGRGNQNELPKQRTQRNTDPIGFMLDITMNGLCTMLPPKLMDRIKKAGIILTTYNIS